MSAGEQKGAKGHDTWKLVSVHVRFQDRGGGVGGNVCKICMGILDLTQAPIVSGPCHHPNGAAQPLWRDLVAEDPFR